MERSTAYILWLSALNNKEFIKQQAEFTPNYLLLESRKISRINTIATITQKNQKEDSSFASITLDDGSAQIRAKAWHEDTKILEDIKLGDVALVIGKLKEYNDELYIAPEIVNKQHPNLLYLRQLNLLQEQGSPQQVQQDLADFDPLDASQVKEEKVSSFTESKRQKLMNAISHLDTELGASLTEVIQASGLEEQEAQAILKELLQEGEIFKISPDRIKIT
ncbi:MAG TPA: OB-fold nucleic acid binding domain-containing protein [Candidatus Nanoarchaeia archaeon]|nr:OB-fold nucleic acid binding domain-containing protein [Candidatus Nanoarchaeia archaeon]